MDKFDDITDSLDEELSYRELRNALSNFTAPKKGEISNVKIVNIVEDGVLVDIGGKYEGIVPNEDFGERGIPSEFKTGLEIPVIINEMDNVSGYVIVSYTKAKQKIVWGELKNLFSNKEPIKGKVIKKIKGGFIVDIGIDAFLPIRQVDIKSVKKIDTLLGKELSFLIMELDDRNKNVVLSHKQYIELERKRYRDKIFSTLKVDDIVEGIVTNITDFGIFVDLGGGVEGLVHVSNIAWYRIEKIKDYVKIGDKLKLKVIEINPKEDKISLSLKHLMPHPWDEIENKYPVNKVVTGKVTHITEFGAFVELEKGIEGLLHVSELVWNKHINHPKEIIKEGDQLTLKIIEVDKQNRKLSLSLKRMSVNPWEELKNKYPSGTRLKCKVTNILPFGAFVSIDDNFEGLIHLNDMSWMKKIKNPNEILKVGQEIEAVVLEINPELEKASLSIKHLKEDPFVKYKVGTVVRCKISKILDFGVFVELEDSIEAFMHISEMLIEKGKHPKELFSVGQEIEAKVIKADRLERKIEVSIKKLERDREKELIKKYSKVEQQKLGDLLEEKE